MAHDLSDVVQTDAWQQLVSFLTQMASISDPSVERADLVQECFLGLHHASLRYDQHHERGANLLTFARSWMQQRVRRTARNSTIAIPVRFRDSVSKRPETMLRTVEWDDAVAHERQRESPEDMVIASQSYAELTSFARQALTLEQYHVLVMTAEGWSAQEIAERLNRDPDDVHALLRTARRVMKKALRSRDDSPP